MRRTLPFAYSKDAVPVAILHYWERTGGRELREIQIGSEPWFAWLAQEQSFKFTYWTQAGSSVNFTVRPEKRAQRTYWQGWKTIRGQTLKKYLAPSAQLSKAKLDAVGEWFAEQVQAQTEERRELKLYAATLDLVALVEELIDHCANPAVAQHARLELERLKHYVGN